MDAPETPGTETPGTETPGPGTPPPRQRLKRDKCDEPVQKKSRFNPAWWPALRQERQKKLPFKGTLGVEGEGEWWVEGDTVRLELTAVHKAYMAMIKEKDDEIEALKKNMMTLSKHFAIDMDHLQSKHESLCDDLSITEEELGIIQSTQKEWIGRTLKMKFILDEIKKVGALPKDHADWVFPMVDDITIPDVSINIRDEFVPTAQTDNIDWSDDEDDGVDLWPHPDPVFTDDGGVDNLSDATIGFTDDEEEDGLDEFGSMMNVINFVITESQTRTIQRTIHYYGLPRAILERNATRIQRAWREYRRSECVARSRRIRTIAANKIQRAWCQRCYDKLLRKIAVSKIQRAWRQRAWRQRCYDKMIARFSLINIQGPGVPPIHFDFNYI